MKRVPLTMHRVPFTGTVINRIIEVANSSRRCEVEEKPVPVTMNRVYLTMKRVPFTMNRVPFTMIEKGDLMQAR